MSAYAERVIDQLGDSDFFNQAGLEFVRDAWIAGQFGEMRKAESVRLLSEERPDLALRFSDGREERYELVEAGIPRKRGDEYQRAETENVRNSDGPASKWATATQALEAITKAAEKKAERAENLQRSGTPYPAGTSLLIYLNVSEYGSHEREIESTFCAAVNTARKWFSSIWILWKAQAYQV